ncbi:MAG: phosphotransferase family protein [Rhizobiales bacterium]|nr:phosphotransferase family protein [Hyphomicrobiales bacterium]
MPDALETIDVLPQHRFDEAQLAAYLARELPMFGTFEVRQFQGGQSNPTFLLIGNDEELVLRKKPPGQLLRGAHQVEREFQVMSALGPTGVPVPHMHLLCEDEDIIGTAFFIMSCAPGRVSPEPHMPDLAMTSRRPVWLAMAKVLARLHEVDWRKAGLEGFGKPDAYAARQLKTWTRQYEMSKTGEMPAMDKLIARLERTLPDDGPATIVHGDFRPGNMIIALDADEIDAVLDWELSTIGHPLADLGYLCMPYHVPAEVPGIKGLQGLDFKKQGMPDKDEIVIAYAAARGIDPPDNFDYFTAFALFRLAAILQGVYARALQGNASHADARNVGKRAGFLADCGWAIASTL